MPEVTITLNTPVLVKGKAVTTLTMRPSTVGDEEDAQALAVDLGRPLVPLTSELCLLATLTGLAYDDLRALPSVEYAKIRTAYGEANRPRPTLEAAPPLKTEGKDTTPEKH